MTLGVFGCEQKPDPQALAKQSGPIAIAAAYFVLHLVTSTRYGCFRDALYYLACSRHLDWGYVDHPPLIALIAWVATHTLGTSLPALIFWPGLAGAGPALMINAGLFEKGIIGFVGAIGILTYVPDASIMLCSLSKERLCSARRRASRKGKASLFSG